MCVCVCVCDSGTAEVLEERCENSHSCALVQQSAVSSQANKWSFFLCRLNLKENKIPFTFHLDSVGFLGEREHGCSDLLNLLPIHIN